jgi:hypothetical protein
VPAAGVGDLADVDDAGDRGVAMSGRPRAHARKWRTLASSGLLAGLGRPRGGPPPGRTHDETGGILAARGASFTTNWSSNRGRGPRGSRPRMASEKQQYMHPSRSSVPAAPPGGTANPARPYPASAGPGCQPRSPRIAGRYPESFGFLWDCERRSLARRSIARSDRDRARKRVLLWRRVSGRLRPGRLQARSV